MAIVNCVGNEPKRVFAGDSEVKKMYLGDTLVYSSPFDAKIEYLQSTGTQWMDIKDNMEDGDDFEFDFSITSLNGAGVVYGIYTGSTWGTQAPIMWWKDRKTWKMCFMGSGTQLGSPFSSPSTTLRYKAQFHIENSNYSVTINGTTQTFSSAAFTSYNPCALFATTSGQSNGVVTSVTNNSYIKLYSFKHWRRGILIKDLIPVRKGTVGYMYDNVNLELFENKGSGNFTLGADV